MVHLNDSEAIIDARVRIGHFITQVYNPKRPIGVNLGIFHGIL